MNEVLAPEIELSDLELALRSARRARLSLAGADPDSAVSREALRNPASLDLHRALAADPV